MVSYAEDFIILSQNFQNFFKSLCYVVSIIFLTGKIIKDLKEEFMSCPYFKEGYLGICVAPDAIHVPSIDEMERLCFRSWYRTCPNIASLRNSVYREEISH
jgi:hypothetical protein